MLLLLVFLILLFLVGKSLVGMTLAAAGGAIGLILVISILFIKKRNNNVLTAAERQQMEEQQRVRRIQEEERRHREEAEQRESVKPVITYPEKVDHFNRAYFYPDVKIIPVPGGAAHVVAGEPLTFYDEDSVSVYQGDHCIGHMEENRLAEMVRTWIKSDDPILGYVANYPENGSCAEIGLAFYQDKLARFLSRNPGAKPYKLTGKPDDDYLGVSVGDICTVDHDLEHDRYDVVSYGSVIGRLPASALAFAKEQECDPEDLTVYVASVEYDFDKDRDIISVYLDD